MNAQFDNPDVPCAACGTPVDQDRVRCSFCDLLLNPDTPPVVGSLVPEMQKQDMEEIAKKQKEVFQAILTNSKGDINRTRNSLIFKRFVQKVGDWSNLEPIYNKFNKEQDDFYRNSARNEILITDEKRLVFIEGAKDKIRLGLVSVDNFGRLLWNQEAEVEWKNIFPDLNEDEEMRGCQMAGGFHIVEADLDSKVKFLILDQLSKWGTDNTNSRLLFFRGSFGWKQLDMLLNALEQDGLRFTQIGFDSRKYGNVVDLLNAKGQEMRSRYPLALLGVDVDQDGKVALKTADIFSRDTAWGEMPAMREIKITSKSTDPEGMFIPIIWRTGERQEDFVPVRCLELPISIQPEQTLIFKPDGRKVVIVSTSSHGELKEVNINLSQLLLQVPRKINLQKPTTDLVIILDTLMSKEFLCERGKFAVEVARAIEKAINSIQGSANASGKSLRVALIAYGDRDGARESYEANGGSWPSPIQSISWNSVDNVNQFIDQIVPTPVQYCHYEASLEEALQSANNMDWQETADKILLTIGQRPPHPSERDLNRDFSASSPVGIDWVEEVKHLVHKGVRSVAIICPIFWGEEGSHRDLGGDEFWKELGYTFRCNYMELPPGQLAERILGTADSMLQAGALRLPMLVS